MQITQTLTRSAELYADHTATIFGSRRRTWREVHGRVSRLAGALAHHGVRIGDFVAVIAFNSDLYLELFYAVPWAGGVIIPLNIRWAVPEIIEALRGSPPAVLILDDAFLHLADALADKLPSIRCIIALGHAPLSGGIRAYEQLIEEHPSIPDQQRAGEALYTRFYTGGTTGRPRCVGITHQNVIFSSLSYVAQLQLTATMVHLQVGGMFHLSGAGHMWYTTLVGGTHVILPKFEVAPVLAAIHDHRVTNTVLLPTMVNMLLNDPQIASRDLSSLKMCIYGGSPMPQALMDAFMLRLPSWHFTQVYALTESCGIATFLSWADHFTTELRAAKSLSVGRPALGVDIRVMRKEDVEAERGEVGEITVRGLNVMRGYEGQADLTEKTLRNGYLHTGDLGWMDNESFLHIVDRSKDMIISGGENVYSVEVESALYRNPRVRECAVIGIPHPTWGEAVHAIVVCKEGESTTEEALIAHCRQLIAGYKCPKTIVFQLDSLPVSPAGKLRKDLLRAPYWENSNQQGPTLSGRTA